MVCNHAGSEIESKNPARNNLMNVDLVIIEFERERLEFVSYKSQGSARVIKFSLPLRFVIPSQEH